jgi:hypothetical protein
MENEGTLDPGNDADIYCLHLTLSRLLPKATEVWMETWNNHKISTERHRTPVQLFVEETRHLQMTWEDNGGDLPLELDHLTN